MAATLTRLRQGVTTLDLNDGIRFRLLKAEWLPGMIVPMARTFAEVPETLPVHLLGNANAAIPLMALRDLTVLLEQATRWRAGENVAPVYLDVCPTNSFPQRQLSAVVTGWEPSGMVPGDFMDRISTGRDIALTLTLQRRHPWLMTEWRYPQLLPNTSWATDPGLIAPWSTATTPYGAQGRVLVGTALGEEYIYPDLINIQAGRQYVVAFRAALAAAGSNTVEVAFEVGGVQQSLALTPPVVITATGPLSSEATSQWCVFGLSALTTSASARIELRYQASNPDFYITELLMVEASASTFDDRWHLRYASRRDSTTSVLTTCPGIGTISWDTTAHQTPSPVRLRITTTNAGQMQPGYFVTFPADSLTYGIRPQDIVSIPPWTIVADAASLPLNGASVLRYTPTGLGSTSHQLSDLAAAGTEINSPQAYSFLLLRNNSASTTFFVKLQFCYVRSGAGIEIIAETAVVMVAAGATLPAWYPMGMTAIPLYSGQTINMVRIGAQASAASGSLDCAGFAWLAAGPTVSIMQTDALQDYAPAAPYNDTPILFDHGWDSLPAPLVRGDGPTMRNIFRSRSRPVAVTTTTSMRVMWLATRGSYWRHTDPGGTITNFQATGERLLAYPTPA